MRMLWTVTQNTHSKKLESLLCFCIVGMLQIFQVDKYMNGEHNKTVYKNWKKNLFTSPGVQNFSAPDATKIPEQVERKPLGIVLWNEEDPTKREFGEDIMFWWTWAL